MDFTACAVVRLRVGLSVLLLTSGCGSRSRSEAFHDRVDEVLRRLSADPILALLFKAAFAGDEEPIAIVNLVRVCGAYERTLIDARLPQDRSLEGDTAALSPPVADQCVTLRDVEGTLVHAQTDDATPTDGQTLGPCRWPSAADAQRINDLISGCDDFSIFGVAADGHDAFCIKANVFVGAGEKNPTYSLIVMSCL